MTHHPTPSTFSVEEAIRQAYKARQARFAAAARKCPQPEEPPPQPRRDRFLQVQQDDHVKRWQWHIASANSPSGYIAQRAEELGFTATEVKGKSRLKTVVAVRHQILHEVHQKWPHMSLSQLAQLFGGRDHTTILTTLKKFGYVSGQPPRMTKERIAQIKQLHADGETLEEIARVMNCSTSTIRVHTNPKYRERREQQNVAAREARRKAKAARG